MSDPDESALAATARVYANTGWVVFPVWWPAEGGCACPEGMSCPSPAKHPLTSRGVHDASGDPAVLAAWWSRWPHANIGLATGANGLAVLDVDPRHDGLSSLARLTASLAARGYLVPATQTVFTGSGGLHLYFAAPPEGVKGMSKPFGPDLPGIDTRGRGNYVVAPPSRHASGGSYAWGDFLRGPAPWPAALTQLMVEAVQ